MKNPQNASYYILPRSYQAMVQWAPVLEDLHREYPADGYHVDVLYYQMREDIYRKMISGISLRFLSVIGTVSDRHGTVTSNLDRCLKKWL